MVVHNYKSAPLKKAEAPKLCRSNRPLLMAELLVDHLPLPASRHLKEDEEKKIAH